MVCGDVDQSVTMPWPELSFVDACVPFAVGYDEHELSITWLGYLFGKIVPPSGKWKDGRERESLASATSTGAPMAGIEGFGEVEDQHADLYGVLKLGNLGFQPCSHGNFLGSILGTRIVRDKIGDILLQDCGFDGCPVILLEGLSKDEFGPWNELCGERIKDAHGHPYIIGREGCPVFFKRSGEWKWREVVDFGLGCRSAPDHASSAEEL
ncbi:hypothetical protein Tco_0340376 [Tanacetum coccineum]